MFDSTSSGSRTSKPAQSSAITTTDLCYRPGPGFRLDNVSLEVPTGSIFGFLGANGSGKSTTLRILMGMLPADSGLVTVLGQAVPENMPAVLAETGYVPERPHLYRHLTVAESMQVHAGFFPKWDWADANRLVDRFLLDPAQRIRSLSKGEVGKLLVLQAICQRPRLMILDEPTDGLDPVVRQDLYQAIVDYVASTGATVLLSSHLVHELERVCDHIAVIDHGRILDQGPMESFRGGIRSLRVRKPMEQGFPLPFEVLRRDATGQGGEELWLVRGWSDSMAQIFDADGDSGLTEVTAFDLETGFVELLRAARNPTTTKETVEV